MKLLRSFDRFQQRHRPLAFAMAVVKKFADDQGGLLVAVIAYRAFLSLFPLLLLLTTILGYVLSGNPDAQHAVINSALAQIPIVGVKVNSLHGSAAGIAIGLAGSLVGGLGVTLAAQTAFHRVWAVPFKSRPDFVRSRLRGLALLGSLGALNIASTVASGLVAGGLGGTGLRIGGIAVSLLLNFGLFFAAFRLLSVESVGTRDLLPGVVMAAVAWELLQALGGYFVGHTVRHVSPTYGSFALVLGLIAWIHLGATATVYAAEANAVLRERLWPRSLFGNERPEDEQMLRSLAKVEERDDRETVDVRFR